MNQEEPSAFTTYQCRGMLAALRVIASRGLTDYSQLKFFIDRYGFPDLYTYTCISQYCIRYRLSKVHGYLETLNMKDKLFKRDSELYKAIEDGDVEFVSALIRAGININQKSEDFETPLLLAIRKRKLDIVRLLLSRGAQTDVEGQKGCNPMHLLAALPWPDNSKPDGARLASMTTEFGLKLFRCFQTYTHDINAKCVDTLITPLHLAAKHGQVELVQALLTRGADVHARRVDGRTPLMCAARRVRSENSEIAEVLLDYGSNLEAMDVLYKTPLMHAILRNNHNIIDIFLRRGANLMARTLVGSTPLHFACRNNDAQYKSLTILLRFLCERGQDVNTRDDLGNPPLFCAVSFCPGKYVQLLLNNGADINAVNKHGVSVFDLMLFRQESVVALFNHIIRLKVAGLPVLDKLNQRYEACSLECVYQESLRRCNKEMRELKKNTLLYDILIGDDLSRFCSTRTVARITSRSLRDYPRYGPLIEYKLKRLRYRARFLEAATHQYYEYLVDRPHVKYWVLPPDIIRKVLDNFTNLELMTFLDIKWSGELSWKKAQWSARSRQIRRLKE